MARRARLDGAGEAHHVMMRGIERRRIFLCPEDEDDFIARLDRLLPEEGWRCFAWALMPNHVHLVIQSSLGSLSRLMARLNTGYARSFNLRHDRVGYLFQNRFKSRVVADEADLLGLLRYVLRNPLEARLVPDLHQLELYPGSAYGALTGRRPAHGFESTPECLAMFADDPEAARSRLRRWMADDWRPPEPNEVYPASYDHDSVAAKPALGLQVPHALKLLIPAGASTDTAVELLIEQLCIATGVTRDSVRSPDRRGRIADVRSIICSVAVDRLKVRRQTIADLLGISQTAVSHAARRGRARLTDAAFRIEILEEPPPHPKE